MKTNTVKRDAHGLYVRTDASVFRPVLTRWSYPVMQPAALAKLKAGQHPLVGDPYSPDPELFKEGEAVAARHVNQTPYARVQTPDGRQAFWWSHGSYYTGGGTVPSEACWTPKPWAR